MRKNIPQVLTVFLELLMSCLFPEEWFVMRKQNYAAERAFGNMASSTPVLSKKYAH